MPAEMARAGVTFSSAIGQQRPGCPRRGSRARRRSARKAALALLKRQHDLLEPLAAALGEAAAKLKTCSVCGNIDTREPCSICQDQRRDGRLIVVVEEVGDLWALERASVV